MQVTHTQRRTKPIHLVSHQSSLVVYHTFSFFEYEAYQKIYYICDMNTTTKPKHIGRNISRIRELRGMKQEALAMAIGVSQQTISNIENSETVEDEKLLQIANALNVSTDAIKNFNEDSILNIVSNNFTSNDSSTLNAINIQPNFNPLDKVVELYERLVQAEKEKVAYLEKLLNNK